MAIFKNEAMNIREWVEHYKWQGVDKILLLDNNSTDNWRDIQGLDATVLPAPKNHAQVENYNTIGLPWLREHKVDILAILDIDEFMFGTDGKNLGQHVREIFSEPVSQISCKWTMFGSSGHVKHPKSIREAFTWRKKELDSNTKSIMRLRDIVSLDIHKSKVSGRSIECPPGIQLNHYAIQSKEFFEKVKMSRGAADVVVNVRDWAYFDKYDHKEETDTQLRNLVRRHRGLTCCAKVKRTPGGALNIGLQH